MSKDVKIALFGLVLVSFTLTASREAKADASSWAFAGVGPVAFKQGTDALAPRAATMFDIGVGTTPDATLIYGGLFRVIPYVSEGVDLALCARIATNGFQAAKFGVAFDAGGYYRISDKPSQGFTGALTVGFPLGFSLAFLGQYGTDNALTLGAIAGLDFLRLTVYRQSLLDIFPNPYPAQQQARR